MQNAAKTPLVDLLRKSPRESWAEIAEPSGWTYHTNIGNLLHQAADEIDRLRRNAQQSVQRIAFGAFTAGVLVGIVVSLIVVFVQIGVR